MGLLFLCRNVWMEICDILCQANVIRLFIKVNLIDIKLTPFMSFRLYFLVPACIFTISSIKDVWSQLHTESILTNSVDWIKACAWTLQLNCDLQASICYQYAFTVRHQQYVCRDQSSDSPAPVIFRLSVDTKRRHERGAAVSSPGWVSATLAVVEAL